MMLFFEIFVPVFYTANFRRVLNHMLHWASKNLGYLERDSREREERIMNELIKKETPLHKAYEFSKDKTSAYRMLVHQPYHNPNYFDRNGHFPVWYKIKECCNLYGRVKNLRDGQFHSRHSIFADTYKSILQDFIINIQAGLKIYNCPLKAFDCLQYAIDQTDKTRIFFFFKEAGMLTNFGMLMEAHSDKWDKFDYPLSLKRLCSNTVRLSVRRNAFLGVNQLSKSHYLPASGNLREYITLQDILKSYEDISAYIWSSSP